MKSKLSIMSSTKFLVIAFAIVFAADAVVQAATESKRTTAAAAPTSQKQFNTPKEAADALIAAANSFDVAQLKEILGADAADIVSSEDPVSDKNRAASFAAKAKEKTNIGMDPKNGNQAIVTV